MIDTPIQEFDTLSINTTKSGVPCAWEVGTNYYSSGHTMLIGDNNGKPKKPVPKTNSIYKTAWGRTNRTNNVLVPIEIGDTIVKATHHDKHFQIIIYEVVGIVSDEQAQVKVVDIFNITYGEYLLYDKYKSIVEIAMEKAINDVDRPYYVLT